MKFELTNRVVQKLGIACLVVIGIAAAWALFPVPPWVSMKVQIPEGDTPDAIYEALRSAAQRGDYTTVFGCLTMDARRELVETMIMDVGFYAYHHRIPGSEPTRIRLNDEGKVLAAHCFELATKWGISGRNPSRKPEQIRDPAVFVKEAWLALTHPDRAFFGSKETISDINVRGDHAYAKVDTSFRRQGKTQYYVHFKNRDGKWLIDEGPWWMPWGIHTNNRKPSQENRQSVTGYD